MGAKSYSTWSTWMHWIVALLVICMLSTFLVDGLPRRMISEAFVIHKSIGITLLFLMLMRFFFIHKHGGLKLAQSIAPWERILAHGVQMSLYVLLLAMPIDGWIMTVAAGKVPTFFGLFPLPLYGVPLDKAFSHSLKEAHKVMAWVLLSLVSLHILGALKHYFIDKN